MKHLALILLLSSCSWGPWAKDNEKKDVETSEKLASIEIALKDNYCPKAISNYYGGDRFHGCDSALFAALLHVACGDVELSRYNNGDGRMCRDWECSCFREELTDDPETEKDERNNGSDSDYSKDMDVGMRLAMTVKPEPELIESIVEWLESSNSQMCTEATDEITRISKCVMPPATFNRWKDILDSAEGQSLTELQDSNDAIGVPKDFQAHLRVLSILGEGELYGGISDISLKQLASQASREDQNALYEGAEALYTDGDMSRAADLWLKYCPLDRLPTTADYCTDYLFQRDYKRDGSVNKDWLPCDEKKGVRPHPGVDCAFAAWVILHNRK